MSMDFASDVLAWDQASRWGKKANNKNRKNIEEQSDPRGGLEKGKWRRSLETMPLMLPFHDTRFWYHALIGQMSSCWQIRSAVDRIALFQCHAPSISAEDFLKHKFWAGNTNFFARLFAYPCSKKSKKYACDRLQKEKLSIQQIKLFLHFPVINYDHIYKAMDL